MNTLFALATPPQASAAALSTPARVVVRDLVLDASIGVYAYERGRRQRIRVSLDIDAVVGGLTTDDGVGAIRAIVDSGHITLIETLAERLAARCLSDERVRGVRVRVEKLDVFPDAAAVGVEIERRRI